MKNLIKIKPEGKVIFVGDTHGDLEASKKVLERYLKDNSVIVFLGDYVDRGKQSRENIEFLLKMKKENPKQIYLLLGNHDSFMQRNCYPANFWQSLDEKDKNKYGKVFAKFPLVLTCGPIIACHGAIPDVNSIEEVNKVKPRDESWIRITWGDFTDENGEVIENGSFSGRPLFGKDYFDRIMARLGFQILIRSHQPNVPEGMMGGRLVTIFTSSAYGRKRVVAIADFDEKKEIRGISDLRIEEI